MISEMQVELVSMDLFADNDELFAKLKEGNPGYDVIVPTNDFVERMIRANMLIKLDTPKFKLQKRRQVFETQHLIPYGPQYALHVRTIGIGYHKSKVSKVPDSWSTLFESSEYSGRIAVLGNPSETIPVAIKYLTLKPLILQQLRLLKI